MKKPEGPHDVLRRSRNRREWVRDLDRWADRLAPRFPDIERHDLELILYEMLRPKSVSRDFLFRSVWNSLRVG